MIDHLGGGHGFGDLLSAARETHWESQAVVQEFKRSRVETERFFEGSTALRPPKSPSR